MPDAYISGEGVRARVSACTGHVCVAQKLRCNTRTLTSGSAARDKKLCGSDALFKTDTARV